MDKYSIDYKGSKQNGLKGRYINYMHIQDLIHKLPSVFKVKKLGNSVEGRVIESVTFGGGKNRILMWSQMHGNESTTTKAVFDLLNLLQLNNDFYALIFEECTLQIIPMLNPDGANAYTRTNANKIDLNRDAIDKSQPESVILREAFDFFKPHYCFNLHDQRTIFNVGKADKPATVSFLAPAHDIERSISNSRLTSMQLIVAMNEILTSVIPNQIGRYDDSFNPNCIGDSFQMTTTPTILFESGHYPQDYQREETRKYIFMSLCEVLKVIATDAIHDYDYEDYFKIPENGKMYLDVLIRNASLLDESKFNKNDAIGVLFKEVLKDNKIEFVPVVEEVGELNSFYFHEVLDCKNSTDFKKVKAMNLIF